ncbi:hypothetical protein DY000_02040057 [Brassica cretica]|uniref:Uncharacterized protein n=1 Tax=Brassica cretica TaxID=69181 RepID=A0ABQ7BGR7_BRACR|nr:hypothetical protein DY000_02040057 [Brassica cretica]
MRSVTVVVATPVKTDLRSDGGGDERWLMGEMAVVVGTSDVGYDERDRGSGDSGEDFVEVCEIELWLR